MFLGCSRHRVVANLNGNFKYSSNRYGNYTYPDSKAWRFAIAGTLAEDIHAYGTPWFSKERFCLPGPGVHTEVSGSLRFKEALEWNHLFVLVKRILLLRRVTLSCWLSVSAFSRCQLRYGDDFRFFSDVYTAVCYIRMTPPKRGILIAAIS